MAKTSSDNSSQQDLNLNILDKVDLGDFDEIAAFQKGGKIENTGGDDDDDNDDDDDDDEGQGDDDKKTKPPVKKTEPQKAPVIELTDDELIAGLQRTSGKTPADPKKQTKPAASKKDDNDNDSGEGADANPNPDSAFSIHYQMMVDAGEWEEVEGFDGTKESYLKAREHNENIKIEEGVNTFLEDAFKNNPEGRAVGKKLLAHLAAGGRVSDFVAVQAPQELDFDSLEDQDDEKAAAAALDILPKYYQSIGWKKPEIAKKMEQLKKTGGEVDEAKLIAEPFKEMISKREAQITTQLNQNKAAETTAKKVLNTKLVTSIDKGHDFGYFQIGKTKKEKEEIRDYIFTPSEETNVSKFATDLNEALKDPDFLLFAANVLKNQIHKADPKKLVKKSDSGDEIDALEEKLSKSLLHKNLSTKSADATGTTKRSSGKELAFNLEEAVVIN